MNRSALPLVWGSISARAQMADPEGLTGRGVNRGAVRAAVVGQDSLDRDAMTGVERHGSLPEARLPAVARFCNRP
jgi:hypothetical protein